MVMINRQKVLVVIATAMIIVMCACSRDAGESVKMTNNGIVYDTREVFAMDTVMTLQIYGNECEEAIDASVEEIQRLDKMFSTGNENSEISVLNNNKYATVSDESMELISTSLYINEKTEGAFDISIYPLMEEWGFTDKDFNVPSEERIKELLEWVGEEKIQINDADNTVTLPENMKVDLGGIAKGYTSSQIMEILKEYDVECGIVSLGGNVQVYGKKYDGNEWSVGIENPEGGDEYVGIVKVQDKAVVTSGDYQRYFEKDGKKYHHIIDPKTGFPSDSGLTSVSVVCEDGTLADALSTSFFIMGKDMTLEFWKEYGDELKFDVVLVGRDKSIWVTEGIEKNFTSINEYEIVEW